MKLLAVPLLALALAGCKKTDEWYYAEYDAADRYNKALWDEFDRRYGIQDVRNVDTSPPRVGEAMLLRADPDNSPKVTVVGLSRDGKTATILAVRRAEHSDHADQVSTAEVPVDLLYRQGYVTHRYWNKDTGAEITREEFEAARLERYDKKRRPYPSR